MSLCGCYLRMAQESDDSAAKVDDNQEVEPLIPPRHPTYLNFRLQEQQVICRCTRFILAVFKVSFCSLGLWGYQWWNYIPRILFMAVCIYQVVYQVYVDCGCPNFDCHFVQNLTDNKTLYKDDVATGATVFTILSLATLISYPCFIGCFIVAKRKDSALVPPAESLMDFLNETDAILLFIAFVGIILSFMGLAASFYKLPATNQIRDLHFTIAAVTGTGAQFFSHWASIITCHVFAVSSSTIVSAYSVWFVVHWFTYGAGAVVAVIYISEESISRAKYHTHAMEFVFLGLLLVCVLYLFVFPCACAARITSNCAGIYEKINCTTSEDWPAQGHPFKDRRNISLFISYAKDRHCGFKVGRITFNTSLAWLSFFFGLTGLLYHFF
ncbi:uncharacterized protein LOC144643123 isoform X3 [Oculina patagonica]